MNENENATCAHTCDTRTPETPSFKDFISAAGDKCGRYSPFLGVEDLWYNCSLPKKLALVRELQRGTWRKSRLDWCIKDFPEPVPENLNGTVKGREMIDNGQAKCAKFNGKFGVYSLEDITLFNLPLAAQD